MDPKAGDLIAGKYELDRLLAQGGMGSVWASHHIKLGASLAIKFLDPRFAKTEAFVQRFEREARAAAALKSPHVVHVQDFGLEADTPYLVMELLEGEDLGVRLNRVKRLSLAEANFILAQVGRALKKAHDAGIVHRDLKPANLFLAQIEDETVVKVLDFGIAKEAQQVGEATRTGEVFGSPHYMSPEQARADKGIDHRTDLWAVGIILYRAVTGTLPYPGEVLGAVLSKILMDPPPPVRFAAPDLPPALDGFFQKALMKPKELRFQNIRDLVRAFAEATGQVPVSPHTTMGSDASTSTKSLSAHTPNPGPRVAPTGTQKMATPVNDAAPGPLRGPLLQAQVAPTTEVPTAPLLADAESEAPTTTFESGPHLASLPSLPAAAPPVRPFEPQGKSGQLSSTLTAAHTAVGSRRDTNRSRGVAAALTALLLAGSLVTFLVFRSSGSEDSPRPLAPKPEPNIESPPVAPAPSAHETAGPTGGQGTSAVGDSAPPPASQTATAQTPPPVTAKAASGDVPAGTRPMVTTRATVKPPSKVPKPQNTWGI